MLNLEILLTDGFILEEEVSPTQLFITDMTLKITGFKGALGRLGASVDFGGFKPFRGFRGLEGLQNVHGLHVVFG